MKTREEFITGMCLTWDHSFLAPQQEVFPGHVFGLTDDQKKALWNNMAQVFDNDIAKYVIQKETVVSRTLATSESIKNDRTTSDVLSHMMTEVGELAQEIIISNGKSYKSPGDDGVTGEAIDVMLCALDIIALEEPGCSEEELFEYAVKKLNKWVKTTTKK